MNFISATLSSRVQALGAKLMQDFKQVGFSSNNPKMESFNKKEEKVAEADGTKPEVEDQDKANEMQETENIIDSIPRQVKQFYMQVPTQYRLLYLLAFLYAHQDQKVIVFASNCETVNLLTQICKSLNWDKCINRKGNVEKRQSDADKKSSEKSVVDFT